MVVDSSALAKYMLREEGWEDVEKRLERGAVTLDLAVKEVLNALWKRAMRGELERSYALEVAKAS